MRLSAADEQAYAEAVGARNLMQIRQAAYLSSDSAKLGRLCEICEAVLDDDTVPLARRVILAEQYRLGEQP